MQCLENLWCDKQYGIAGCPEQWLGRFSDIIGWDPSVCKSNRLHIDILRFSFLILGYILWIPLKRSVIFLQSWTSTGYFSNSTGSFVTNCRFSSIVGPESPIQAFPSPMLDLTGLYLRRSQSAFISPPYVWSQVIWDSSAGTTTHDEMSDTRLILNLHLTIINVNQIACKHYYVSSNHPSSTPELSWYYILSSINCWLKSDIELQDTIRQILFPKLFNFKLVEVWWCNLEMCVMRIKGPLKTLASF